MALILVTGATGRIGRALVKALLARGDKVRAVIRPKSNNILLTNVEKFAHDLSSSPLPKEAFAGVQKVAHLAGLVGDYPYAKLVQANALPVKNLLSNCPSSIQRIVLASSISIYGEYKGQTVDESFAPKPDSNYGKSKLLGETFAREYCGSLPITILRPGMVYGEGFEEGYFPVLDYVRRGKMKIIGDGKNRIPLVHISDVTSAFLLALDSRSPSGSTFNICGTEEPTQEELLSLAAQELGVAPPSGRVSAGMAKILAIAKSALASAGIGKPPKVSAEYLRQLTLDRAYSCAKAEAELGYKARVKIRVGLKEVVRDYLSKK